MSWRDNLRDVSLGGIPFFYDDTTAEIGRRSQRHEYPFQDKAYHEDLGLKTIVHTINGYVWGENSDVLAKNLMAVINAKGPKILVHPDLGETLVMCVSCRMRTTTREGGYVSFNLTFEETGKAREPRVAVATTARIDAAADTSLNAIQKAFEEAFNVDGLPQFVADDGADQVTSSIDTIRGAFSDLRQDEQKLAGWVNQAVDVQSRALAIVRDPMLLATELADMIGLPLTLPGTQLARSLNRLFDYGNDSISIAPLTATRVAQQANRDAFSALIRQTAVVQAARVSAREDFPNRTAALERRDEIADVIEAEMMTAPDTSYRALVQLRAEVVKGIDARAAQLPRLKTFTPIITRPALALAHELYGNDPVVALAMADDLVARNGVRHPGFVPGGDALEVTINV